MFLTRSEYDRSVGARWKGARPGPDPGLSHCRRPVRLRNEVALPHPLPCLRSASSSHPFAEAAFRLWLQGVFLPQGVYAGARCSSLFTPALFSVSVAEKLL